MKIHSHIRKTDFIDLKHIIYLVGTHKTLYGANGFISEIVFAEMIATGIWLKYWFKLWIDWLNSENFVGNCLYCKGLRLKVENGKRQEEEEGVDKSLDNLRKGEEMEKTDKLKKSEEDGKSAEECLRAYQISLSYANTPGR